MCYSGGWKALTKPYVFMLLALLLSCSYPLKVQAAPPLRVGLLDFYPPFAYWDEEGEHRGYDRDVAQALCREMKRDCEFVLMDSVGLSQSLEKGELDMAVAGCRKNSPTTTVIEYSNSYFRSQTVFLVRNRVYSGSIADLRNKRIGVRAGSSHALYAHKMNLANLVEAPYAELLSLLDGGGLDALFVDGLAAYDFLRQESSLGFDMIFSDISSNDLLTRGCVGIRKGAKISLDEVNRAIEQLWLSGQLSMLATRYFHFSSY